MALKVAIQMNPIASIDISMEATYLLGLEAQARGHQLYYYTPDKLTYLSGKITAQGHSLKLKRDEYKLGKAEMLVLNKMDVILLRQNPPFDIAYITNTYLLSRLHPKPFVMNNPASVRDLPEKLFPTLLAEFMPPTLITADVNEMKDFRKHYKDIIIKPLYGHSSRSVFRIRPDDNNFQSLLETLFLHGKEPWVVQKFLPEMKDKECRVIMIDGEFAAIAGRIPARGATGTDIHAGAKYVKAKPTKRHMEICEALGPILKDKGLIFAGIDIIGDWLTEINITSPGTLAYITQLYGKKLEVDIWDAIEERL